jgi:hypothetical protein
VIKDWKSMQVTDVSGTHHVPVQRVRRDAFWESLDLPDGVPFGMLLYRFYDACGEPLYIGKSTAPFGRLEGHRKQAEWWGLVEFIAMSMYPSHGLLLRAELAAIRSEQPRFNKAGLRGKKRVELHLHGSADDAADVLLDEADPEFLADLVRILSTPDRALLAVAPPCPGFC